MMVQALVVRQASGSIGWMAPAGCAPRPWLAVDWGRGLPSAGELLRCAPTDRDLLADLPIMLHIPLQRLAAVQQQLCYYAAAVAPSSSIGCRCRLPAALRRRPAIVHTAPAIVVGAAGWPSRAAATAATHLMVSMESRPLL